jgi:indole-3-glycerol phosphate synthase
MGRFRDALAGPGLSTIAEVKRRSPSAGDLRPDADPAGLAGAFEASGAAAVSILVDDRFGGSLADLRAARATTSLPLLAKGFFSTRAHLEDVRAAGADAALLLLRDLDDAAVDELARAARELGLDALVEAHDAEELERAGVLGAEIVGVNARDLDTFEVDRRAQLELVARAPRDRVVVAESGIANRAQGAAAELAGADAILVGSALMRASDPAAKLGELLARPLVKVCGLTRAEDVAAAAAAGDPVAVGMVRDGGRRVGQVLAGLVSFFNPGLVVIGGGVAGIGHALLAEIRGVVYRRSLPLATGNMPIVLSELGGEAGVIGAARLISDHVFSAV